MINVYSDTGSRLWNFKQNATRRIFYWHVFEFFLLIQAYINQLDLRTPTDNSSQTLTSVYNWNDGRFLTLVVGQPPLWWNTKNLKRIRYAPAGMQGADIGTQSKNRSMAETVSDRAPQWSGQTKEKLQKIFCHWCGKKNRQGAPQRNRTQRPMDAGRQMVQWVGFWRIQHIRRPHIL